MDDTWPHRAAMASPSEFQLAEHASTLRALANALRAIASAQWIVADADAHGILGQILRSRTPVEIDAHMDSLMVRVGQLLAERTGDESELHRLAALTGPRAQSRPLGHAHPGLEASVPGSSAQPRRFMKL